MDRTFQIDSQLRERRKDCHLRRNEAKLDVEPNLNGEEDAVVSVVIDEETVLVPLLAMPKEKDDVISVEQLVIPLLQISEIQIEEIYGFYTGFINRI